ncbi:hypothetical protein [Amycolatopsis sp.]|uniref:hypothetical protein n=1 Tax=Amycolatopsis sp. TaxID=37632 RepID=UPI002D7E5C05|nr:hypothetical protein [Amycolatopsis sp.]HET6709774.1 hypothetical protein [Amycolatopsis sp.]
MKHLAVRVLLPLAAATAFTGLAAAPAPADTPGVVVVDEPDTSGLHNIWTFAPLGVPVLGLIQSVNGVPGKLLPSF